MMTFDDIYQRIADGLPAADLSEAENALDLLTPRCAKAPVMIAVTLAEARRFRKDDKQFWTDAKSRWQFPGDKTIYHYHGVGCLLISLREFHGSAETEKENRAIETQARRCYAQCLKLEFGKLLKLCTIANDRKRGIVEVINFMKLHYRPEWTNKEFIRHVDELYGTRPAPTGQMSFQFDIFDDVAPETVADVLQRTPGPAEALQIAHNGALWCRGASRLLSGYADQIPDAALGEFERLSAELEEAKRNLDRLIAAKRRTALALP